MEEGSPPATRRATEDNRNATQETTTDAIQLIEDFLSSGNPTAHVKSMWEWVKDALVGTREPGADQGKKDAFESHS
jgi:hypothetical protein